MTRAEAKIEAARLVLGLLSNAGDGWQEFARPSDVPAIEAEMRKIETWLRRQATGGDKILGRQMERELGRQVRPPKGQRRVIEAMARELGEG